MLDDSVHKVLDRTFAREREKNWDARECHIQSIGASYIPTLSQSSMYQVLNSEHGSSAPAQE